MVDGIAQGAVDLGHIADTKARREGARVGKAAPQKATEDALTMKTMRQDVCTEGSLVE